MKNKLFEKWERNLLVSCFLIFVFIIGLNYMVSCNSCSLNQVYNITIGVCCSVIAAISIFKLQLFYKSKALSNRYSHLAGEYERKNIGLDNIPDNELEDLRKDNNGLKMFVKYKGGHQFELYVEYWRSKKGKVIANIEFNESNKNIATGRYYYTEGEGLEGHFGTYSLHIPLKEDNTIIIIYQHLYPRNIENFPDNNRGWEQWIKVPS